MASQDYEEFIVALNDQGARYLIVGAHAVALHGRPRATKDLDILIEDSDANATRVLAALRAFFGGADLGYSVDDLTDPRWIIQLGVAPVRIDLLSQLEGFDDFDRLWINRIDAKFGPVASHFLGLDDLIQAKEAAGRMQDKADVAALRRIRRRDQAR